MYIRIDEIDCIHNWELISESHSSCHDTYFYECNLCGCRLNKGGSIDGDIYELSITFKDLRKLKLKRLSDECR